MPSKAKERKSKPTDSKESSKKRFNLNFLNRINIVYILFFLLIIASFLIGVLVTQVKYLKDGGSVITGSNDSLAGEAAPIQPTGPVDVSVGELPILGKKDAPVTIVEFSDFQCPFCKSFFDETLPKIKSEYIDTGKARLAYRHFPLTTIHPNAQKAAEASECANEQDKFWDYHDQLFTNQADWESLAANEALEKFVEYANTVGIDGETLRECVTSGKMEERVSKDIEDGVAAGVDGTPATFVNGILITGAVPFEQFKAQIDAALEEN